MSIIPSLKAKFRSTGAYEYVRRWKARRQEEKYLLLRERYRRMAPDFFSSPGYQEKSRSLLMERIPRRPVAKQSPGEVRLFVVSWTGLEGSWFDGEYARNFDARVFSATRHMRGFEEGKADLAAFSTGADERDRLLSAFHRPAGEAWEAWRGRLQEDILAVVDEAHRQSPVDLMVMYGGYGVISPRTLARVRSQGIPVAILSLDDKHSFLGNRRGKDGLAGHYDVHLTNSLECVRWYFAEGIPSFYFPQGVDPVLAEGPDVPRDMDVSFVGQAYGGRMRLVRELRRQGIRVECFGRGWENGKVDDQEGIYRRSKICLGVGWTGLSDRMTCLKSRDFEAPACGALYLTSYSEELARLYRIGSEIACFMDEMDCAEQILYYLENEEELRAVARAGKERALGEHTWTDRMVSLLRWMGILEV